MPAIGKIIRLIGVITKKANIAYSGNMHIIDVQIIDQDGNLNSELALTEEIKFQIKKDKKDITIEIEKTKGDGIEINQPNEGYLRIILSPTDTEIANKRYFMGLQLKWSADEIFEVDIEINEVKTNRFYIKQDVVNT